MAKVKSTAPSKARSRKPAQPKNQSNPRLLRPGNLPDLAAILRALVEAHALISVAHRAIAASDDHDAEERVLRAGVNALDAVYNQVDAAEVQLAHFRRKHTSSVGGAS
jgi:hypothetical protein